MLGPNDRHLKLLEIHFKGAIKAKEGALYKEENIPLKPLMRLLELMVLLLSKSHDLQERDILYLTQVFETMDDDTLISFYDDRKAIIHTTEGKAVLPLTVSQEKYVDKLRNKPLVFGLGPAGTGKTFLAVMHGVSLLKKGHIKKILLTRPAVEAGENLGFLPGDLREKIDPYLRPLYDALYHVLGVKTVEEYLAKNVIEIAPLAYMRGRTLDHAYVILDEAQNTTANQMKLFLTRLGIESKMVVNGDVTQTDLPKNVTSGLVHAASILNDIDDIGIHHFERFDVIRHPLIQTILERYDA